MQRTWTNRRLIIKEIVFALVFFLLLTADQIAKTHFKNVYENSSWNSTTVIDGFFYFTYSFNTGAAWSFLAGVSWSQIFFKILTCVALVIFFVYYIYVMKSGYKFLRVGILLIICGTIGNFIDRLAYNGVVDFLGFVFGEYHFPIFNFADCYLTIGVIIAIAHYLFIDKNAIFKKSDGKAKISSK